MAYTFTVRKSSDARCSAVGYSSRDRESDDRVRLRNSLLGNGFHVPSIMVLISLLAGLCDTKVQFMPDPTLSSIRARTEHTLCGGDWLYRAPGLLSANAIAADVQNQFRQS